MKSVVTADASGRKNEESLQELFTFEATEKWSLIKKEQVGDNQVYTYAYNEILTPGVRSTALFDHVTFINVVSGPLDNTKLDIPVKGYAIQTTNTGGTEGSVVDKAKIAFEKIVKE